MSERAGDAPAALIALRSCCCRAATSSRAFWLQTGLFAMAAAIGAIGLTLLVGHHRASCRSRTRSSSPSAPTATATSPGRRAAGSASTPPGGLGLPPSLAMVGAVALAGLAGALFSPIAGRLRGIYLGLASIGLVFIGQHILFNADGRHRRLQRPRRRAVRAVRLQLLRRRPGDLSVLGVPFGQLERLWYLGLVLVALAWWFARNLVAQPARAARCRQCATARSPPRSWASTSRVYKAAAFTVSSMYAGLAGVLLALAFGRIVPDPSASCCRSTSW